jgi:hypothetical protein
VDDLVRVAQLLVSAGLLLIACRSLQWAQRTFAQKERHEAAKDEVRTAVHVSVLPGDVDPVQAGLLLDDDFTQQFRWLIFLRGIYVDLSFVTWQQRVGCSLISLGPGLVTSAEIPYTVEVFDAKPAPGQTPRDIIKGVFRCYYIPAGSARSATNAITTTYFPFFRITLEQPTVSDIRGQVAVAVPDPHLSRTSLDVDNLAIWEAIHALQNQQAAL